MDKVYTLLEKAVRKELSFYFPKVSFKLSTYKPTLAGTVARGQYKVRGNILYVEFFEEHLKEKGIKEHQVRAIVENVLNSSDNETDVSKVVFKRKTVPVKISENRMASLKSDIAEMMEDEDNQETVLNTLNILSKSLSRNDAEMVKSVIAEYETR